MGQKAAEGIDLNLKKKKKLHPPPKQQNFSRLGASYCELAVHVQRVKNLILRESSQLAQCTLEKAATAEEEGGEDVSAWGGGRVVDTRGPEGHHASMFHI